MNQEFPGQRYKFFSKFCPDKTNFLAAFQTSKDITADIIEKLEYRKMYPLQLHTLTLSRRPDGV
jgi:hypothetical protein